MQPYTLVRDERDGIEMKNPAIMDVLDGDLDEFMHAYLRHKSGAAPQEIMTTIELPDLAATESLGRRLGAQLFPGSGHRPERPARSRQDSSHPRHRRRAHWATPNQVIEPDLYVDSRVCRPAAGLSLRCVSIEERGWSSAISASMNTSPPVACASSNGLINSLTVSCPTKRLTDLAYAHSALLQWIADCHRISHWDTIHQRC